MKKHYNITIQGKIQGVMFRSMARMEAMKLELKGFARNMPDGSIYIEVEGEEEPLANFITWCHKGPRHAEVEKIEIQPHPVRSFSVFRLIGGNG